MKTLFTEHPASVGESYGEHMATAGWFARELLIAGFACAVHSVLPFLFVRTASVRVEKLYERMVRNRHRAQPLQTLEAQPS
jgi:hypothetical protein